MPFYKSTYFWNYVGNSGLPVGFSESFEFERSSDDNAIGAAINGGYAKARQITISDDWNLVGMRLSKLLQVSVVGPPARCYVGQSLVYTCPRNLFGGNADSADTPWAALLYDLVGTNDVAGWPTKAKPRKFFLRGIPDTWWQNDQVAVPAGRDRAIRDFFRFIINDLQAGNVEPNAACDDLLINPYTQACFRRVANRQIGRPFGLIRGRQ